MTLLEDVDGAPLQATLQLRDGVDPDLAGLCQPMLARETNRRLGTSCPIAVDTIELLHTVAEHEGARLNLLTGPDDIARAATILAAAERARYLTPQLHAEMVSELRWPGDPCPDTGIDVLSLELDPGDLAVIDILRRPDVMAYLAQWNAGTALGENTRQRIVASSAVAVILVSGDTLTDYARGGSAAEAVWITAQQRGLAVQPISPVFLYARDVKDLAELSSAFADELGDLQEEFQQLVQIPVDRFPVLWCCDSLSVTQLRCGAVAVLIASVCCSANTGYRRGTMPGALDDLVTAAAAELMAATAANHVAVSERVLADLVSHFGVDFGFLRHNDHNIHATVLVAAWPPRPEIPDPDPLGVVYFADADSVFARAETHEKARRFASRPWQTPTINKISRTARVFPPVSLAVVPLLSGDVTTGPWASASSAIGNGCRRSSMR